MCGLRFLGFMLLTRCFCFRLLFIVIPPSACVHSTVVFGAADRWRLPSSPPLSLRHPRRGRPNKTQTQSEKKPADSLITTLSADKIRSILEPALDKFRATKEGGPDVERVGGADSASAPVPLGRKGKAFKFSDSSCPVAFVEASAKENELDALFGKLRDIQSH